MALAIEFPQVVWSIEFGGDETVVRQVTMTGGGGAGGGGVTVHNLSLLHVSEPTRLGMNSDAVFCLKKK